MKKSIKKKLAFSYAILIILSVLLFSAFHFYQIYQYTSQQNKNEIEREFQQTLNGINSILTQLNVVQMQAVEIIIYNSDSSGKTEIVRKRKALKNYKNIENGFLALRRSCPYIADITWIEEEGFVISTNGNLRYTDFKENQGIQRLREEKLESLFAIPYNRNNYLIDGLDEYVFSYVKNIYDICNMKNKKGILQIDLYYDPLYNYIELLNCADGRDAYISDEKGNIVCASEKERLGKSAENFHEEYTFMGIKIGGYEWKDKLDNGWILHIQGNDRVLLAKLFENLRTSVVLMAIVIVISILYIDYFSGHITGPLQMIINQLKRAEMTAKFTKVDTKSELDEILALEYSYNEMIDRIDWLIEKNTIIRNEMTYAKLLALQTQINPHFLSNSFELIRGIAIKTGNMEVEKITEALSMMYRYILNDSDKVVSLAEEIEYVKNYIKIQEYRFGKMVEVFFHLPKDLQKYRILCLSIQPLVENAYRHGFDGLGHSQILLIECLEQEQYLKIVVSDNGVGMTEERLTEVRRELNKPIQTDTKRTDQDYLGVNGIGLKNVNDRLVLFFGESSKLEITSEVGKGTKISFCIRKDMEYESINY